MEIDNSYIYAHIRTDTNEVFYIGIGVKYRAWQKTMRNIHWHRIVRKTKYKVELIFQNISWSLACELEKILIEKYGRRDLKTGTLVNLTNGGEGTFGNKLSEKTKEKIRQKSLGNKRCVGIKRSKETKNKLSIIAKNRPKKIDGKCAKIIQLYIEGKKRKEIIGLGFNENTVDRQIKKYTNGY